MTFALQTSFKQQISEKRRNIRNLFTEARANGNAARVQSTKSVCELPLNKQD